MPFLTKATQNSSEKWMILDLGQETCTTGVEYLTVQEAKSATPQRAEVALTVLNRAGEANGGPVWASWW